MTKTQTDRVERLVALLTKQSQARIAPDKAANPLVNHSLDEITGGAGIKKGADHFPAVNMAAKIDNLKVDTDSDVPPAEQVQEYIENQVANHLELGRFEAREKGKKDSSAKRMAMAKQRRQRAESFERLAFDADKHQRQIDPKRLEQAWSVVFHLVEIVNKVAKSKQRWAGRLLGSNLDDVPQMAMERMALMLARQTTFDLGLLAEAARQLKESHHGIPGDQGSVRLSKIEATPKTNTQVQVADEADRKARKEMRKARKWIMGCVNNRVMGAIVDSYQSPSNLRWDNLDLIQTVVSTINGVGDDPMTNRFKADRAPAFLGTRMASPGRFDPNLLAIAINAAITDKGLDPLVDFLLDEQHMQTDGAVRWSKFARDIFLLTPGGHGPWMWEQVKSVTNHHKRARNAQGVAAMHHVRNLFAWLPDLIHDVVNSFDPQFRFWMDGRAVLASDFEWTYLPDSTTKRYPLVPSLRYDDIEGAAEALNEYLAQLTSGNDIINSILEA